MSTYAVQGETLGLIADAIRGKLGTDEPMEVSSMASAIESIPSGGNFEFGSFVGTGTSAMGIEHIEGDATKIIFGVVSINKDDYDALESKANVLIANSVVKGINAEYYRDVWFPNYVVLTNASAVKQWGVVTSYSEATRMLQPSLDGIRITTGNPAYKFISGVRYNYMIVYGD